jgi:two-component system, NtrC family, nitrogen regulation sensor histidine kinase NtrY
VLVIEDLSELITAQRASAWQEVARRMAHEIKNPLTPIQLSAERIAKRFRESANGGSGEEIHTTDSQTVRVIQDGTTTIIREVQSLKAMVDEFSRFARLPKAEPSSGDLNDIVRQVLRLYEDRSSEVRIRGDLAAKLPETMIDAEQMKRVFVNLIENSIEAFETQTSENEICVSTRHDSARDLIIAEVTDNGKGIDSSDLQKLFQPYFSTKGRGTGLGLAIVQRIVGEHGGKIKVVGNKPKGAKFIIELPIYMRQL